jgi:hypothetical protein
MNVAANTSPAPVASTSRAGRGRTVNRSPFTKRIAPSFPAVTATMGTR